MSTWLEWGSNVAVRPAPRPHPLARPTALTRAQKSPFKLVADKVVSVVYPSPRGVGLAEAFAEAAPEPVAAVAEASSRNKRVSFVPAPSASCKRPKAAAPNLNRPRQRAAPGVRVKSEAMRSQPRRESRRKSGFYSEKNLQHMACVHRPRGRSFSLASSRFIFLSPQVERHWLKWRSDHLRVGVDARCRRIALPAPCAAAVRRRLQNAGWSRAGQKPKRAWRPAPLNPLPGRTGVCSRLGGLGRRHPARPQPCAAAGSEHATVARLAGIA